MLSLRKSWYLLFLTPVFFLLWTLLSRNTDKKLSDYSRVEKQTELKNVVKNLEASRASCLIETLEGNKFLLESAYDFKTNKINLNKYLIRSDSILKKSGSLTIYVKRNGELYGFRLRGFH
jgi:hypothetical protein